MRRALQSDILIGKIYIFKGEVKILGNQENQDIFQFVKRNIFSLNYKSAMAKQVLSKLFSLYNFQYGYVNHHVLINWLLLIILKLNFLAGKKKL